MFSYMPLYGYELYDNKGRSLSVRQFVPERAYTTNTTYSFALVAKWLQEKYPKSGPYSGNLYTMDVIPEMRQNLK